MNNNPGNHSIKVLLVEDSPTDARLLLHELKEIQGYDFKVTWVERVGDAIANLSKESFDVGLLDLSLPDSSGIATFTRIQEAAPALPVVVLTGATDEAMGDEAIRHGVQDYLVKGSADGKAVARAIRYAVERKMGEDAIRKLNAELELRVLEIQANNNALSESRQAALNLMEDALKARKQAEEANHDLLRSREEWVETFNVIPDHIAILDDKHRIVRANKTMADKLGLTPEEVIGKPCHLCVHGSKDPISACPHSLLLKDGKQHIAEVFEEKLGGAFLVSVTPIFGADGAIKGSVHVARDITERKKREDELYKLNRTLEEQPGHDAYLGRKGVS